MDWKVWVSKLCGGRQFSFLQNTYRTAEGPIQPPEMGTRVLLGIKRLYLGLYRPPPSSAKVRAE